MPSPIRLSLIIDGKDAMVVSAGEIGAALGKGMEQGVSRSNAALSQLESTLKKIQSVGGGANLGEGIRQQIADAERHVASGAANIQSRLGSAFSPLQSAGGFVRGLEDGFIRLGFAISGAERAARLLWGMASTPFEALMTAGDDTRKWELAMSGVVGGMTRAREVNSALLQDLKSIPLSLEQIRTLSLSMAKQDFFQSAIALADPQKTAEMVSSMSATVAQLSALNPDTSVDTITKTIQQAAQGQSRGMRLKLGIDPEDLAKLEHLDSSKQFNGNSELLIDSLRKYTDLLAKGDDTGRGELAGVSFQKLKDTASVALSRIADADGGIYDIAVSRIKAVTSGLMDYLNGPQFAGRADEISKSLGGLLDSVGGSALKLIQGLSGAKTLADTPDAIAGQIADITKNLNDWAKDLPGVAAATGRELHSLISDIESLGHALHVVAHPVQAMQDLSGASSDSTVEARYAAIVARMSDMGITGASVGHLAIPRPDTVPGPMGGPPISTSPSDIDYTGKPLWQGAPTIDTSGVASGAKRLLAEQIFQSLQRQDISGLGNLDETKWHLRNSIPEFDSRLSDAQSASTVTAGYRLPPALQSQVNGIGKDEIEPSYATKFHSFDVLAEQIASGSGAADKLTAAFETADRKLEQLSGNGKGPDVFTLIAQWRDKTSAQLTTTIAALDAEISRDPAHARDIGDRVAALSAALTKVVDGYSGEVNALAGEITEKIGQYGVQISENVKKAGSVYGAMILNQFSQGTTPAQQHAIALMAKAGLYPDLGLGSIPLEDKAAFLTSRTTENLAAVKQLGAAGVEFSDFQAQGMTASPEAMARMGLGGPLPQQGSVLSFLGGRSSIASENVRVYQDALAGAQSDLSAAGAALAAKPDDETARRAFVQAKAAVIEYTAEVQKAQQSTTTLFSSFISFGDRTQQAMESSLSKGIESAINGTAKASAIIRGFAMDIERAFAETASHSLISSIMGTPNGQSGIGNGLGGIIGAGASGLMDLIASSSYGAAPSFAGVAADPLVSSFQGMAFADGGVANSPMISVFGEGRTAEAYIPMRGGHVPLGTDSSGGVHAMLPGGRRIPASFFADGGTAGRFNNSMSLGPNGSSGGGDTAFHIYNVVSAAEAMKQGYREGGRNMILNDVYRAAAPGGHIRRVLSKG